MSETESVALRIQGLNFPVAPVYFEGHVLSSTEAKQLEQTRREALRNNFSSVVKKLCTEEKVEDGSELSDDLKISLAEKFEAYVERFEFSSRSGIARIAVDPVERESVKLITPLLLAALKKKGIERKDLPEGKWEELVKGALDKRPDIVEEAKRRIEAAKSLASSVLDD